MAIQDIDPERRNLMVTSLGFIIFYLGEGKMESDKLTLPLVNIEFKNTVFLASMAWIMLFWFVFRYWQTRDMETVAFARDIGDIADKDFQIRVVEEKTGLKFEEVNGFGRVQQA